MESGRGLGFLSSYTGGGGLASSTERVKGKRIFSQLPLIRKCALTFDLLSVVEGPVVLDHLPRGKGHVSGSLRRDVIIYVHLFLSE